MKNRKHNPKIKAAIVAILIIFMGLKSNAQNEALKIGDTFADLKLENIINYNGISLSTKAFSGKILIFDFWGSHCGGCIASMPKLAKLQSKYDRKLKIFLVATEPVSEVVRFYDRRPNLKALGLPVICSDSILSDLFPHVGQPHVAWIGKDRIVKAITKSKYVTENNLNRLIETSKLNLPVKKDFMEFHDNKPLFSYKGYDLGKFTLQSSILTEEIKGISNNGGSLRIDSNRYKIFIKNATVPQLYAFAYTREYPLTPQEVKYYVKYDINNIKLSKKYCYEQIFPFLNSKRADFRAHILMRKDLNRFFNLTDTLKWVESECYVLFVKDSSIIKENPPNRTIRKKHLYYTEYLSVSPELIAAYLLIYMKPDKLILYKGPDNVRVKINLPKKIKNIVALRKRLNKAGLGIKESKEKIKVIELKEKG